MSEWSKEWPKWRWKRHRDYRRAMRKQMWNAKKAAHDAATGCAFMPPEAYAKYKIALQMIDEVYDILKEGR